MAALVTAGLLEAQFLEHPLGTYTGPHVLRINERIQCDASNISDHAFADSLNRVMDAVETAPQVQNVAHYDVLAATGFDAMSGAGCKSAVVEVVIGGRLDVTNVLSAPVVVITNIYLEHTDIMGPTLQHIAREKAGIITAGADVICGMSKDDPLSAIFINEANLHSPPARVFFVPGTPESSLFDKNLSLARAALECFAKRHGVKMAHGETLLSLATARKAMASIPGRQEVFRLGKLRTPVVIDGAHVAESVASVLNETLESHRCRDLAVVLAVGKDKDAHAICMAVRNRNPVCVIATDAGSEGGGSLVDASQLKDILVGMNLECVEAIEDIRLAFAKVLELAGTANVCVVCIGTMRIVTEMRPLLVKENCSEMP